MKPAGALDALRDQRVEAAARQRRVLVFMAPAWLWLGLWGGLSLWAELAGPGADPWMVWDVLRFLLPVLATFPVAWWLGWAQAPRHPWRRLVWAALGQGLLLVLAWGLLEAYLWFQVVPRETVGGFGPSSALHLPSGPPGMEVGVLGGVWALLALLSQAVVARWCLKPRTGRLNGRVSGS